MNVSSGARTGLAENLTSSIEVKPDAPIELAENSRNGKAVQGLSDPPRDAKRTDARSDSSPALDESIDSAGGRRSSSGLPSQPIQEPTARGAEANFNAVDFGSALSQPREDQSASTVNEASSPLKDPVVPLQPQYGIHPAHAQGRAETVKPQPDALSPRTPHPTALSSEVHAEPVSREDQTNHAAPRSLDTRIVQSKLALTAAMKAAMGAHSAMQTSQLTYSVHPQGLMEPVNPLSSAAITRPESGNDLAARDAIQPQASTLSTLQDPFAVLDARGMPSSTWLQAGAHHAEAGYLDPSLGWVGVRAEANGNVLHAAILPGSGEAAQALGTHLTALNSFMAEHHGRSSTVTLESPDQGQTQGGLIYSGGHHGEGSGQQQPHQGKSRDGMLTAVSEGIRSTRTSTQHATNPPYTGGGVHISVIA
jgi:hypothetical protein